jgi:hypothetical protein
VVRFPLLLEAYWLGMISAIRRDRFLGGAGFDVVRAIDRGAPPFGAEEDRLVATALRSLDRATRAIPVSLGCLQRTIVLHRLLARRGIASTPSIGVRRVGRRLEAHAWLEHRGRILTSSEAHCRSYHQLQSDRATRSTE